MRYFISDTHFGDDRLNLFGRELVANNSEEIDNIIITNYNNKITNDDTVYFLGDVALSSEGLKKVSLLNGNKILIRGNYDQQFSVEELSIYFTEVCDNMTIYIDDEPIFLNHYPVDASQNLFNLVGHVHSLWKVQKNMINVSIDAWHFQPVSEDMIRFQIGGIRKHYDQNVFAGELESNNIKTDVDKHKFQLNWIKIENTQTPEWRTSNGEELHIHEIYGKYYAAISYIPLRFEGTKNEIEEKFKIKI